MSKEKIMAVIFLADGFEEIEAITAADILRRAEVPTEIVSVMGRIEVISARGIKLLCDSNFEEARGIIDNAEVLILPGGGEGTSNLKKHEGLSKVLKEFDMKKKKLAAICAAPSVLGQLGILKGKKAVCYPGFEVELLGAEISSAAVVVSDNVITAKAAGSASEFAFKIVELIKSESGLDGQKTAARIKTQMLY